MGMDAVQEPDRELYALLHLDPDASDDDIKKAYRQWAQVYHPDKHRTVQMQDIATQNFQRIREAYEILIDERKRQIYDIYGMEGLKSGMELGPKLKSREEIREEFEKLRARQAEQKLATHVHHSGSMLVNLSLLDAFKSSFRRGPTLTGMAMSTQVQAQVSKKDTVLAGGNMYLRRGMGGGTVTVVLRRQICPMSSVELLAVAGLRSLFSCQMSRQLSSHSTGTLGLSVNLRDGSVTLAETWTRQLTESTSGTIQLLLGPDSGVAIGWQHHGKKNAMSSEIKVGPAAVGITGQVTRQFSLKSKGRVSGKIGSTGIEMEIGGERNISDHSAAGMFCVIGIQGVSWKLRFTRGGQKFVIPILLAAPFNPVIALGALILPSSLYALLKIYVVKPYLLKRTQRKSLEQRRLTITQVLEARAVAEKAQTLLKTVADRKQEKAEKLGGLVITSAVYGNLKAQNREEKKLHDEDEDFPPPFLDVTIPLQFLVDEFGQLKLHEGVKKSGLMGFCDPCPGESKQLEVSYTCQGLLHRVVVGDYEELVIPQADHRVSSDQTNSV